MSGGGRSPGVASTGLTIRERVIRNLVATLRSVQAIGEPQPDPDNAPGVAAAASGTYAGAVTRRYALQVVQAGASGVARVTVSDDTPAEIQDLWPDGEALDDGPVSVAATSGTPIDVGTLGAALSLTWSGTLPLGSTWRVWAGTFQSSLGAVLRGVDDFDDTRAWVQVGRPDGRPVDGPIGKRTWLLTFQLLIRFRAEPDVESALEVVLGDIERAVRQDITRGGWAIRTEIDAESATPLQDTKPWGLAMLPLTILYRTADDDPRSL
jgi:hypothetical protein